MALIHIGNKSFELLHENRNGWNLEAFRDRYSEVLDRYDYIIGDWGYNQLRLKGFFRDNTPKAPKDSLYSSMTDYVNEYCNFGCAYFVVEKKHMSKAEQEQAYLDEDSDLQQHSTDDADKLLLEEPTELTIPSEQKNDQITLAAENPAQQGQAQTLPKQRSNQHDSKQGKERRAERKQEEKEGKASRKADAKNEEKAEERGEGKPKKEYYYRKGQRYRKSNKQDGAKAANHKQEQGQTVSKQPTHTNNNELEYSKT